MTQIDLSHAIAATGDEWQKPGVRVVDPVTGAAWRRMFDSWQADNDAAKEITNSSHLATYSGLRAIAAGPDWQDAATAGVLLGLMPDAVMRRAWPDLNAVCQRDGWAVLVKSGLIREVSQTRNESIARAYLASKGAM